MAQKENDLNYIRSNSKPQENESLWAYVIIDYYTDKITNNLKEPMVC